MDCVSGRRRRILFVQATEAAAYPPIINAAMLMAENDWDVTILTAPTEDLPFKFPEHERIRVVKMPSRPRNRMSKPEYLSYCKEAAILGFRIRPSVVYASDPLGAIPGLMVAKTTGATLVYHEHDSPNSPPSSHASKIINNFRRVAARASRLIIFPNKERADQAQLELGFSKANLRVVWNMPRLEEMPPNPNRDARILTLYYHGSITPVRLPVSVIDALCSFDGQVKLHLVGYEVPSSVGYVDEIQRRARAAAKDDVIIHMGKQPERSSILRLASNADVGLALMPRVSDDVNMVNMVGASCKSFDYMAAGLALVVTHSAAWIDTFVRPGHAFCVDPNDTVAVRGLIQQLLESRAVVAQMGKCNQDKFLESWNYNIAFGTVLREMELWQHHPNGGKWF